MTGEGVGLVETRLLHQHPVTFTSDRSLPKGHVPQEYHSFNVSTLTWLLDTVTFSYSLLSARRETTA